MGNFADRMTDAVRVKRTPLVVGIDPRPDRLPEPLKRHVAEATDPLRACADAYQRFAAGIIDAVADHAAAVKPQSAFFEALGQAGVKAFEATCAHARKRGLLVIGDVKRGDIGSTCEAYAAAYLGETAFSGRRLREGPCDAVTVNPYLGFDGVQPFVEVGKAHGRGLFVLVKTSNPSSADFQDLETDGAPLFERVAEAVNRWGAEDIGRCGYSGVGAVVGATWPDLVTRLRGLMPKALFLLPGVGAQGASARNVIGAFDSNGLGGLVAASRHVIFAYDREPFRDTLAADRWAEAVREAARELTGELREALAI